MHIRMVSSFFFTNSTGVPQGDTPGQMYPLSNNSCNCIFNFVNSGTLIQYGVLEMGDALGINSIVKSMSLLGGKPGISSGNTSTESFPMRLFSIIGVFSLELIKPTWLAYNWHPFLMNLII